MLVTRLDVPDGTRLSFQPDKGPVTHTEDFHDLGLVLIAERHADESVEAAEQLTDDRMVLECEGVEASELSKALNWPTGETLMPGMVRFGPQVYPATLQIRARPHGLRATLRSAQ
jgi:hypothetical protein